MSFPIYRPRRLRANETIRRDGAARPTLRPADFILPLFVTYGKNVKNEIKSMPGQFQMSVDNLKKEANEIKSLGIPAVILFGIPEHKDEEGTSAFDPHGPVQEAIKAIKDKNPEPYGHNRRLHVRIYFARPLWYH